MHASALAVNATYTKRGQAFVRALQQRTLLLASPVLPTQLKLLANGTSGFNAPSPYGYCHKEDEVVHVYNSDTAVCRLPHAAYGTFGVRGAEHLAKINLLYFDHTQKNQLATWLSMFYQGCQTKDLLKLLLE